MRLLLSTAMAKMMMMMMIKMMAAGTGAREGYEMNIRL